MRVTQAQVHLASTHHRAEHHVETREVEVFVRLGDPVELSPAGQAALDLARAADAAPGVPDALADDDEDALGDDIRALIIRELLRRLTGDEPAEPTGDDLRPDALPEARLEDGGRPLQNQRPTWGAIVRESTEVSTVERTTFSLRGRIETDDNRAIDLTLDLRMSRATYEKFSREERFGAALKDPLVLSFDGAPATLTGARVAFDLDADGADEAIPTLAGDQAFLVHDTDGDGLVKDGTELLGALSGDAYADLARLDGDRSGFIDAGDAAWSRLRLWQARADGSRQLVGLAERGMGAISLARVGSAFQLGHGAGLLGAVRESGFWVGEDGKAGLVQRIDVAV